MIPLDDGAKIFVVEMKTKLRREVTGRQVSPFVYQYKAFCTFVQHSAIHKVHTPRYISNWVIRPLHLTIHAVSNQRSITVSNIRVLILDTASTLCHSLSSSTPE